LNVIIFLFPLLNGATYSCLLERVSTTILNNLYNDLSSILLLYSCFYNTHYIDSITYCYCNNQNR